MNKRNSASKTNTTKHAEAGEFERLSNKELHKLVCQRLPHMSQFPVTDMTRETVIAMLRITTGSEK
jgi:hypothetical protein